MSLPKPDLGQPLPPSGEAGLLAVMATRRSSPPQALGEPGPSKAQIEDLLTLAVRVPDHGKLTPWRFVIIESAAKPALVERLKAVAAGREDPDRDVAKLVKLAAAPLTILVVSRAVEGHKVPVWEQQLSAGSVCFSLLLAADAMGFGAAWITDWYAYDPRALAILGLETSEKVAGFVHVGTPPEPPLERARPDAEPLVSRWTA